MFRIPPAAGLLGLMAALLASCTTGPEVDSTPIASLAEPFSAEHYAVAPTDVLQVDVYREEDLSGKYAVDPSGTINMPLIGRVSVSGLNIRAIEYRLTQLLANGFIVSPDVRVSVVQFRPVFVGGEVAKPGKYMFTPGITVQQAIVLAGGPTRFAAKKFRLQRNDSKKEIRVDGSSVLFPGDILTVGERLF